MREKDAGFHMHRNTPSKRRGCLAEWIMRSRILQLACAVILLIHHARALVCYDCAAPCTHAGVCVTDSGKCFVRRDVNNMVYRGCADRSRWRGLDLEETDPCSLQDYLGWNNTKTLWCLCDTDLCNRAPIEAFPGGAQLLFAFVKNNSQIFMRMARNNSISRGHINRKQTPNFKPKTIREQVNKFARSGNGAQGENRIGQKEGEIAENGYGIKLNEQENDGHNVTAASSRILENYDRSVDRIYNKNEPEIVRHLNKDGVESLEPPQQNKMLESSKILTESVYNPTHMRVRVKYHELQQPQPVMSPADHSDAMSEGNSSEVRYYSETNENTATNMQLFNQDETDEPTSETFYDNSIANNETDLSPQGVNSTLYPTEQTLPESQSIPVDGVIVNDVNIAVTQEIVLHSVDSREEEYGNSTPSHVIHQAEHSDGFSLEVRGCGQITYVGARCPPDYAFIDSLQKCYLVSRDVRNFSDAARFCEDSVTGGLVTIEDDGELECLAEWVDSLPVLLDGWQGWWTDARFSETLREFTWQQTGDVISRQDSRWRPSLVVYPYEQTCVWLVPLSKYSLGNYWCAERSGFICETMPLE